MILSVRAIEPDPIPRMTMPRTFAVYSHALDDTGNYDTPVDVTEVVAKDEKEACRLAARFWELAPKDWCLKGSRLQLDAVQMEG
jgi:hypothetical protein